MWFELLKKHWRAFLVSLSILCAGIIGYHYGKHSVLTQTQIVSSATTSSQTSQNTHSQVQKNIISKHHQVIIIDKKPSGETITTIRNDDTKHINDKTNHTTNKTTNATSSTTKKIVPTLVAQSDAYRPNYSLGLDWTPKYVSTLKESEYTVNAGYRMIGNLWLTSQFNIQRHEAAVGFRIDF